MKAIKLIIDLGCLPDTSVPIKIHANGKLCNVTGVIYTPSVKMKAMGVEFDSTPYIEILYDGD